MTPAETKLVDAMKAAMATGVWVAIKNDTVRWMSEDLLPDPRMLDDKGEIRSWPGDAVFHQLVFVTLIPRSRPGTGARRLGTSAAPWMGRQDQDISFKRAHEVLADPAALFAPRPVVTS